MAGRDTALLVALQRLSAAPDEGVIRSSFSANQRKALDEYMRLTEAVQCRKIGNGSVYSVKHSGVVALKLQELNPVVLGDVGKDTPQRARNIAMRRNSKAGEHGHGCYYLLLRSKAGGHWRDGAGNVMDLTSVTEAQGAGVLRLVHGDDPGWATDGTLWLVENQEVFDRLDWLKDESASVGYYKGMLPNQLLGWLSALPRASKIVLFADYDGVGLMNYSRLIDAVSGDIEFWLMPDWANKLRLFGNNEVWINTHPQFVAAKAALKKHTNLPLEFWALVDDMDKQGLALEHEIVALATNY